MSCRSPVRVVLDRRYGARDIAQRLTSQKKVDEWCEMVVKEDNEALVRGLVTEYYDKCYRIPRGEALHVYHVPDGLITDQAALLASPLVSQITQLGKDYLSDR